MLRLLIVADRADQVAEMLVRARRTARELGGDVETVVVGSDAAVHRWSADAGLGVRIVPVAPGLPMEDRLEAGLLLRPLPERLIVVGRDRASSPVEMCFLSLLLDLRRDLGAVTTGVTTTTPDAAIVDRGGAFNPGFLVPAGGFVGDRRRSVHARLAAIGCDSVAMPTEDRPLRELSA